MARRSIESISGVFDTDTGKLVGIYPAGTQDVSYLPTSENPVSGDPVSAAVDPVTGGIGILGPNGEQVSGNSAPYAFDTRPLAATDNGMNLVCATAQTATVNAGLPVGFGCSFEGAISFTAGSGVTITDLRSTGATDIFCGLIAVGTNAYKVRGGKA
jgi:hypothetical protein